MIYAPMLDWLSRTTGNNLVTVAEKELRREFPTGKGSVSIDQSVWKMSPIELVQRRLGG